jgi:hypothetical protein
MYSVEKKLNFSKILIFVVFCCCKDRRLKHDSVVCAILMYALIRVWQRLVWVIIIIIIIIIVVVFYFLQMLCNDAGVVASTSRHRYLHIDGWTNR